MYHAVSGGFKGAKGATAPGPALLVTQKGPRTLEKIEKKNIWIHPWGTAILTKKTWRIILVNNKFSNKGPADDFGPRPRSP